MFSGFTKSVTNLLTNHPAVAFGTAFAAVAAPAFLKDENRGYLRTAITTAPIIAAMGLAGPGLVTSAGRAIRSGYRFAREMPQVFNKNYSVNYRQLHNALQSGEIDLSIINPALRTWVDDEAVNFFSLADRGAPPIEYSMDKALELFDRLAPDEGKRTLLTYAIEGARQRSASPTQLAGVANRSVLAPMASSELRGIINQNRADPRFVEEFSRRMRWASSLEDVGALVQPLNLGTNQITRFGFSEGIGLLEAQRPEVAAALRTAMGKGVVTDATLVAEQTVDGSIGRLLGVNLKRGKEELALPIFDPAHGTVRLGDKYQHIGVGRRIYNKQGVYDLDVFVSQNLTQNWGVLKEDISRAAYFGGIDPLNEFKIATHWESQLASLSPQALYLASRRAVPTGLPVFGEGVGYAKLAPAEKVAFIRKVMSGGLGREMTAIGSEGGMRKGSFEFGELELLTPGGLPSRAKQAYAYRAFSKELQLAPGTIPTGWGPRVTTSAAEAIGGLPEVRMTVAGITPQEKSLFGDLPRNIADLPAYEETAIKRIMADTGLDYSAAKAAWGKISGKLTAREGFYGAAQRLGYLGEGGVLLHGKFGRLQMEARTTMRVNELHLTPEQLAGTAPIGPNQLIGFSGLEPITSNAPASFIEKASGIGNQFELTMRQVYNVETGAKIDIAGKKGLVAVAGYDAGNVELDEFAKIRELLNFYGETTGAPVAIPEFADAIAPLHYMQGDLGDPFRTLMEQAAELSSQITTARSESVMMQAMLKQGIQPEVLDSVNKYMFDMSTNGWDMNAQRFMENSDVVAGIGNRAARVQEIQRRTTQFIEEIGGLSRQNAAGTGGDLFNMFRKSGMTSFTDYMQRNAMIAGAGFWDTTRRNVPIMTSATFDLFSEMYRAGNVEGIKEIMSRLEFQGGDPGGAAAFMQQYVQRDFTKPMGKVIPIGEAAPSGVSLGTMEGRAGTIFDPRRADIQESFSLALPEPVYALLTGRDVEVRYIPVPGKAVYGGGVNLYEKPGEGLAFGSTKLERKLEDVVRFQTDPVQLSAAVSEYFDEIDRTMFGKTGFYRAKGVDVMGGVSGFLQTRASPANPFEMVISEQMARRVRDPEIRRALGMEVDLATGMEVLAHPEKSAMAVVGRHPIQAAPAMRVRVAPEAGLGPNMIGMDERIRALFGADDDKDILNLFFYRNGTQAEREALASINNLNSAQWRSLNTLEMLYGAAEDSRNITKAGFEKGFLSLPQQVEKAITAGLTEGGRTQQVINRLVSEKVGAYSNLVTQLYTNIEQHPTIGLDVGKEMELGHMFWPVRQFTIAAAKSKAAIDPELAMVPYYRIKAGLRARNAEGVAEVTAGLEAVYSAFNKKAILTEQSAKIYSEMTGKPGIAGEEVDALMDVLHSERGQGLLTEFVTKRNVQADRMAQLITKQAAEMEGTELYSLHAMFQESGSAMPYVRGLVRETRGGRITSRVLGAVNETLRAAAKEGTRGNIGKLALGFGLTAVAGLLTARLKPMASVNAVFGQSSGSFRPEERVATTDHPVGEPYPGSMASVNPPRRQLPPRRGVGTTMVAPMHQRNDLEIRMRATSRQDAAETQRMVSQISGGPGVQNVTVNYRDGWRNKMSRLRQRQTIREQLGS